MNTTKKYKIVYSDKPKLPINPQHRTLSHNVGGDMSVLNVELSARYDCDCIDAVYQVIANNKYKLIPLYGKKALEIKIKNHAFDKDDLMEILTLLCQSK